MCWWYGRPCTSRGWLYMSDVHEIYQLLGWLLYDRQFDQYGTRWHAKGAQCVSSMFGIWCLLYLRRRYSCTTGNQDQRNLPKGSIPATGRNIMHNMSSWQFLPWTNMQWRFIGDWCNQCVWAVQLLNKYRCTVSQQCEWQFIYQ